MDWPKLENSLKNQGVLANPPYRSSPLLKKIRNPPVGFMDWTASFSIHGLLELISLFVNKFLAKRLVNPWNSPIVATQNCCFLSLTFRRWRHGSKANCPNAHMPKYPTVQLPQTSGHYVLCVSGYLHVCAHVCVCTYMCLYTCVCVLRRIRVRGVQRMMCMWACTCTCARANVCICIWMCVLVCMCVCVCVTCDSVFSYVYMQVWVKAAIAVWSGFGL